MILETKRLLLRPWQEVDAKRLYELAKDPKIGPIAGWLPHKNERESLIIIKDVLQAELVFALVEKESGLLLGTVGLDRESNLQEKKDVEAELGYWIGADYWGRGYVPEAALELLSYAFDQLGFTKIWCACDAKNHNSIRVQEKLGFAYQYSEKNHKRRLTGEIIELRVSQMTKEMWEKRKGV